MSIGSIGVRQTNLTITQAGLEIRTTAAVKARVLEVSLLSNNATAATIGLGRPQALGVTPGGTATFQRDDSGDPVCVTTTALSWATSPTVPLVFHRRWSCAAVGAGVIWTFPRGLAIPVSASLVTWNITAVTTTGMDINVALDE
jgi:hypothetical protein